MSAGLEIEVTRRDDAPAEYAWRAVVLDSSVGITSTSDETAWRAVARAIAIFALRRRGCYRPLLEREDLESLMARARAAEAGVRRIRATAAPEAPGMTTWFVGRMNALDTRPPDDGRVCLSCMSAPAAPPHPCPFRASRRCRCCERCERSCL